MQRIGLLDLIFVNFDSVCLNVYDNPIVPIDGQYHPALAVKYRFPQNCDRLVSDRKQKLCFRKTKFDLGILIK